MSRNNDNLLPGFGAGDDPGPRKGHSTSSERILRLICSVQNETNASALVEKIAIDCFHAAQGTPDTLQADVVDKEQLRNAAQERSKNFESKLSSLDPYVQEYGFPKPIYWAQSAFWWCVAGAFTLSDVCLLSYNLQKTSPELAGDLMALAAMAAIPAAATCVIHLSASLRSDSEDDRRSFKRAFGRWVWVAAPVGLLSFSSRLASASADFLTQAVTMVDPALERASAIGSTVVGTATLTAAAVASAFWAEFTWSEHRPVVLKKNPSYVQVLCDLTIARKEASEASKALADAKSRLATYEAGRRAAIADAHATLMSLWRDR